MKFWLVFCVLGVFGVNDILIDSDPGIDDVMAFLMALGNPNVKVHAITLTYGNTVLKNAARNLCSFFHTLDLQAKATGAELYRHNSIPRVAVGAHKPLKGPIYTAGYFHGLDGLGNLTLSHPELIAHDFQDYFDYEFDTNSSNTKYKETHPRKTSSRFVVSPNSAVDEILFQLKSLPPFSLTIVALGPLTNIALAIQKDPITMSRVKRIVVMGGALLVPGNTTPMAEFNFYADPYAVNVVFNATRKKATFPKPIHVTLAPINLTHTTLMSQETMASFLTPAHGQPIATFYTSMLAIPFQKSNSIHGLALHDPVAMGIALDLIDPKPHTKRYAIQVEEESKLARGLCVIDLRPKAKPVPTDDDINVEVAYATDNPNLFQYTLLKASFPCHQPANQIDSSTNINQSIQP